MRRFVVSHVRNGREELAKPRSVLRSIRGSIIPLILLTIASIIWYLITNEIIGLFLLFTSFICVFISIYSFKNRSEKYERHAVTLFIVNASKASKIILNKK